MKKNRSKKIKSNVSKNLYCVVLENAGKRTAGRAGSKIESDGAGVYPWKGWR